MIYRNREEGARLLAKRLASYRGRHPLILTIPRGAVPMGKIVSDALEGELDVILVHKLRAPYQEELAIGSVDEAGHLYLGNAYYSLGLNEAYLEKEKATQVELLRKRRSRYTPVHPPIDPAGRIVIVIDDGIATGASMIAAVRAVRDKKPARLIAATAVAPPDSLAAIEPLADEVVCLQTPDDFYAVGQFFAEFGQVTDEEVIAILSEERTPSKTTPEPVN
ncbi:MAG: phosphoribosyltransferase family protein [Candidatus Manganitrophaceae bacterium]